MSQFDFTAYQLFTPEGQFAHLQRCKRLWGENVVGQFIKVEHARLLWQRLIQKILRCEMYSRLVDAVRVGSAAAGRIVKGVLLHASHVASPRCMAGNFADSRAVVRAFSKPALFGTFTDDPQWKEIQGALLPNQTPNDRPDSITRVFRMKLKEPIKMIKENNVFGYCLEFVMTIEFQERGLPHAPWLVILRRQDVPQTADAYDKFIRGEIPKESDSPSLRATVLKHMVHGPCGPQDVASLCMGMDVSCSKKFPKDLASATTATEDPYRHYRRRSSQDGGESVAFTFGNRASQIDNLWIVPYSPPLLERFDCHINLEIGSSVAVVKNIYKYLYDGPDRAMLLVVPPRPPPGGPRRAGGAPLAGVSNPGGPRPLLGQAPLAEALAVAAALVLRSDGACPPAARGRSTGALRLTAVADARRPRGLGGPPASLSLPRAVTDLLSAEPVLGGRTEAGGHVAVATSLRRWRRGGAPVAGALRAPRLRPRGAALHPRGHPCRWPKRQRPSGCGGGGLPVEGSASARLFWVGARAPLPPLPPPPERPPRELLADTALAAAVLLPGGGMMFRPLCHRETARPRPRPLIPAGDLPRPHTRAAVAAVAAAAAEARRASLPPPAAALIPADPGAGGALGPTSSVGATRPAMSDLALPPEASRRRSLWPAAARARDALAHPSPSPPLRPLGTHRGPPPPGLILLRVRWWFRLLPSPCLRAQARPACAPSPTAARRCRRRLATPRGSATFAARTSFETCRRRWCSNWARRGARGATPRFAPRFHGQASPRWLRTRRDAVPTSGGATFRPPFRHPPAGAPRRPHSAMRGPTRHPRRPPPPGQIYLSWTGRAGNVRAVPFWPRSPRRLTAGRPSSPRPRDLSPPSPPPLGQHGGCRAPMAWRGRGRRLSSPSHGCGYSYSPPFYYITLPRARPHRRRRCRTPRVPPPS